MLNPKNGRSLVVEVTDRGPFTKGRDLDVSESAAEWLGIKDKGVATLDVIVISNKALSA
ncbi:MAG: septal ring lytic transglycosylase RlpA family protein [Patescibacteria group bacterium]|nr:septal ring lytic transglycosylase RlpA family protein [Patescibacteria group bacterium]